MKLNRLGYLIKEGFLSIFTHGFMSFACVMVIVACLLIMGIFTVLAYVVDLNIDEFEQKNQILAFIEERSEGGSTEDYSDLTPSVFRNRYVIYLDDLSMMDLTDDAIKAVNGIAETSASRELSRWFIAFRNVVTLVSVVLIVILFVVSVFIMQNTIKLATFSRREEIGIMKIVGASNSFIRCPFVVEGLILGLLGGVIGFFALWGIYEVASEKILSGMIGSILVIPDFHTMMYPILIIYLVIGFIVGTFGSNIAIRNYLKV